MIHHGYMFPKELFQTYVHMFLGRSSAMSPTGWTSPHPAPCGNCAGLLVYSKALGTPAVCMRSSRTFHERGQRCVAGGFQLSVVIALPVRMLARAAGCRPSADPNCSSLHSGPLWMEMLCLHPSADSQVLEDSFSPTVLTLGNRQVTITHQADVKRHD